VLSRDGIKVFHQRAGKKEIEGWVARVNDAVDSGRSDLFAGAMRTVYAELFQAPLATVRGTEENRFVIIPDGPMHALPFAGLQGTKREKYLIERGSIAIAGSTSLYLYARARDEQFSATATPTAAIVGEPAIDPRTGLSPLPYARREAEELGRLYEATPMLGSDATIARFLKAAKQSTIVHFAGHGVANSHSPWHSMLLLTPQGKDAGELTAEVLMRELSKLERTRLVVLGACKSAGGPPIGPEGVAPLVRPLIAANVPAVVGTLWDVKDATAKDLLVSFHRHYRNGADVATALRNAQLGLLRNKRPAVTWAAFQVIGHAASPYARSAALEDNYNDHLRTEDSVHRPHGLHSQ
jgi:CHAT domain-containing protein